MELPSHSALRNRSSTHPKAISTTPSDAPHVVKPEKQSDMEEVAVIVTGNRDRCSLQFALNAAKKPKCRSSPMEIDRYTAVSAIIRLNRADNESPILRIIQRPDSLAYLLNRQVVNAI